MVHLGKHAIVIGASTGGLLAGRALADYYDEVTLVDRDALPLGSTTVFICPTCIASFLG
jgi:pyruvate/2-oxoglutarate dehydrogenase complex dihydrolipoamide dehydrogenase (E3) component